MVRLDATLDNADWTKQTWDLVGINTLQELAVYLKAKKMTPAQFMTLPVYQHNIATMGWLKGVVTLIEDDGSLLETVTENSPGKHDQKSHGNKYGTDPDTGEKKQIYKGGTGGWKQHTKAQTLVNKTVPPKTVSPIKDALEGKSVQEKEQYLLKNGGQAWIDSLSTQERKALNMYTGHAHEPLNEALEALRNKSPLTGTSEEIYKSATPALLRNATPVDMVVKRGVSSGVVLGLKAGESWTDSGFMSTSIDSGFTGFKLTIQLPKGSPGAYLNPISNFSSEKEFLLPPNSAFHVFDVGPNSATLKYIGTAASA